MKENPFGIRLKRYYRQDERTVAYSMYTLISHYEYDRIATIKIMRTNN